MILIDLRYYTSEFFLRTYNFSQPLTHTMDTNQTSTVQDTVRNLLNNKVSHIVIWKEMKKMGITDSQKMMEILQTCMKPKKQPRTNTQWWSQEPIWRLAAIKDGLYPHDGRPCVPSENGYCIGCGFVVLKKSH